MSSNLKIMNSSAWSDWTLPTLSLSAGKKLLIVPNITPTPDHIVSLDTAVRVGLELEPRVSEVLPAAIILYPQNFTGIDTMPQDLQFVITTLVILGHPHSKHVLQYSSPLLHFAAAILFLL